MPCNNKSLIYTQFFVVMRGALLRHPDCKSVYAGSIPTRASNKLLAAVKTAGLAKASVQHSIYILAHHDRVVTPHGTLG